MTADAPVPVTRSKCPVKFRVSSRLNGTYIAPGRRTGEPLLALGATVRARPASGARRRKPGRRACREARGPAGWRGADPRTRTDRARGKNPSKTRRTRFTRYGWVVRREQVRSSRGGSASVLGGFDTRTDTESVIDNTDSVREGLQCERRGVHGLVSLRAKRALEECGGKLVQVQRLCA